MGPDRKIEHPGGEERQSLAKETSPEPTPRWLSVTVTIGVSDSTDPKLSPEQILRRTDEALYRAKDRGRNQVAT